MRVVLFDIDGTLISTGHAGSRAMLHALRDEFGVPEDTGNVKFAGRTDQGIAQDLFELHGVDYSEENWRRLTSRYLDLLDTYLEILPGKILPGIRCALDELAVDDHIAVGLLTGNMVRGAEKKLSYFKIRPYFQFGAFGDRQPDRSLVARDALSAAQTHLGRRILPRDVWVIGDTPNDVSCARAIGARVVAVATGTFTVEELARHTPDQLFPHFGNVDGFMEVLRHT